jgi:hypothetical protein
MNYQKPEGENISPSSFDVDDLSVEGGRFELEVYPIPVVAMSRELNPEMKRLERPAITTTFGVTLYEYAEDEEMWVFIGNDEQSLEVTPESARRIHRELGAILSRVDEQGIHASAPSGMS